MKGSISQGAFRAAPLAALVAALVAVTVVGCAPPVRVNTMMAPAASFANRGTWSWRPFAGGPIGRSVAGQYIQAAVAQQLAAKGYQMATDGAPGFLMDFHVVLRPEASLEGFGGWGGSLQTIHYTRGMLLVSATDPASGNALWQGVASTVIEPVGGGTQDVEQINSAVAKMFESFPAR
jgi:Domain of unknown function (DUF4136)